LLDATTSVLSQEGASGVSVQRVADVAGTSKGLVHYHFPDKDALLIACAGHLTSIIISTESGALSDSTPVSALDDLWNSYDVTARDGTRRALAALCADVTPATRSALIESATRRRRTAEEVIASLQQLLSFRVPVPRSALAMSYMALTDGLTLDLSVRPDSNARAAFDAFWLAVLTLGAE
jgi:TetR/AcrR family transcriptional repressor of bet genes